MLIADTEVSLNPARVEENFNYFELTKWEGTLDKRVERKTQEDKDEQCRV